MSFFRKYFYSFMFGMLAGLAFPPLYLIIFLPFSFYYLLNKLVNIDFSNPKKYLSVFNYGLTFGFGYFLVQLYWISFSLLVDFATYFWLFPLAISLIPLASALYFTAAALLFYYLINRFKIKNNFLMTVVFSISYVIFEYIKGLIFPWNLFSYVLGFSDILIQPVSVINIYIYNFVVILFFCFSFVLFKFKDKKIYFNKSNGYYSIFYFATLIFVLSFGYFRLKYAKTNKINLNIRIIQANIPQDLKWDFETNRNHLKKHIDMSIGEGFKNIDLIVWSETSIPYILKENSRLPDEFDIIGDKILISGAIRAAKKYGSLEKIWNSIFIINDGAVVDYYDKNILVPFGEYIPFSKYIPFFTKITNGSLDFSKGNGNKTIAIKDVKISPVICYEIVFPDAIIDKANPPDLIINLTNDAWFGNSSGPYQHLVAARFRAVENKLPIIRVANSGISAYIDEYGRVVDYIGLNMEGVEDFIGQAK